MESLLRPVLLAATLSMVALAACGSDDGGDAGAVTTADLDGTTWVAGTVEGHELAGTLTMVFEDGRLSVTGGCNNQAGDYAVEDGRLTAGPMMSTMMACPDDLMAQDAWIAGLLETGVDVAVDGDVLTLTADDTTIAMRQPG